MVCITDRDQVLAVAGGLKKDLVQKAISKELEQLMGKRDIIIASRTDKEFVSITEEGPEEIALQTIAPILCEGDVIGSVILLGKDEKDKMGETEKRLAATAAGFLGRQMEG